MMTTTHDIQRIDRRYEILVAEDSPTQAQHLARMLAAESDYHVRVVGDGHTALRQARAAPPDLLISDSAMPGPIIPPRVVSSRVAVAASRPTRAYRCSRGGMPVRWTS